MQQYGNKRNAVVNDNGIVFVLILIYYLVHGVVDYAADRLK